MSVNRQLPNTDAGRNKALKAAKDKNDSDKNGVLTPKTIDRLNNMQPQFEKLMDERATALRAQTAATEVKDPAQEKAAMFISHFIIVFNKAVMRGVFPASDRAYYKLDVSSGDVPELCSEADITFWGQNLITGEAKRIKDGGAPMAMPSIAEVEAPYKDFVDKNKVQSDAKTAYDKAQEDIEAMRPDADKLILKIWDEVETFYDEDTPSSMRRKAREWGVVYVGDNPATIAGTVTNITTGAPIEGARVFLEETRNEAVTDAAGNYTMETDHEGDAHFQFSAPKFITETKILKLEGGKQYQLDAGIKEEGAA